MTVETLRADDFDHFLQTVTNVICENPAGSISAMARRLWCDHEWFLRKTYDAYSGPNYVAEDHEATCPAS